MAETVRTSAAMLTRLGDGAAAYSTNREMIRDIVASFDITRAAQVNVKDAPYLAIGNGTTDDSTAINAAITAAGVAGGIVFFPAGVYKTTAPIVVPRWVKLVGASAAPVAGATTYDGISVILGAHTGVGIIDLRGTQGAAIKDLKLYGDQTLTPKTGLLLGRTSSASAGVHIFDNISVEGYFTKAAVYSIASEENKFYSPFIALLGGGAKYCFYTSQGDDLSVGGLTASSNIFGTLYSPEFINYVNDATCSVVYINAGAGTFAWSFFGGYLMPKAGAYVTINSGSSDASDSPGPYTFIGVSGELIAGGLNPVSGFNLTSSGVFKLRGLNVIGCKMELDAAGYFVRQGVDLRIHDAFVSASNGLGVGSSIYPAQVINSRIDTGNSTTAVQFGDLEFPTGMLYLPSDTAKGIQFGTAARLRHASGPGEVQLLDAAGAVFTDFAPREIHLQGATKLMTGAGTPEGAVTAGVGSIFLRTDGGISTTLYVKTSGAGNTGWTAK